MEKLNTNTLLKVYFLLLMMVSVTIANAQTYATKNDYTGNWIDDASWNESNALGTTLGDVAVNVDIYGEITINDLIIDGTENVQINVHDTLIITGSLTVNTKLNLHIQSTGYFILRGDFIVENTGSVDYNVGNDGFFGVKGNYTNNGAEGGGLNSDSEYVLGTITNNADHQKVVDSCDEYPNSCSVGTISALVANESSSTRRLLLGNIAINVDITPESPTCHGDSDGSITVEGTSGIWVYRYQFDNDNWDTPSGWTLFTNEPYSTPDTLSPGTYTVYVENDFGESYSEDVTIKEKAELTFEVSGDPYFCSAGTGAFVVDVSGGNPPYTVSVTGPSNYTSIVTDTQTEFTFSSLSGGEYTINVADDPPGCLQPSAKIFDVNIDNALPQFETFPDDQQMLYSDYNTAANADLQDGVVAHTDGATYTLTGGNTIEYGVIDLSNYENPTMDFVFSVNGTPGANDYFLISYSYDGGDFTEPADQYTPTELSEGIQLPINDLPHENGSIVIRVTADFQTSGLSYDFTSFVIAADKVFSTDFTISPDETPTCLDDASGCNGTPTFVDDPPEWLCNSGTNKEFYFERTWTVLDNCGKSNTRTQIIGVGTPPSITAEDDMIVDFCNNENIQVLIPAYSDDCGVASVSWEVTDNTSGASPSSGVLDLGEPDTYISLTLDHPLAGDPDLVYTITWTVTDDAGFTATDNQTITVKPAIDVEINYSDYDFCSGEEVTFNVTITGGTGVYIVNHFVNDSSFGVDGTWAPDNPQNTSGTFTTSALGFETWLSDGFTVSVSDVTTTIDGECASGVFTFTDGGGDFDIHENISTNELKRQ